MSMLSLFLLTTLAAQTNTPKVGRPASPDDVRNYGYSISSNGKGLPTGAGNAADGRFLFGAKCAKCHGEDGEGNIGPALVGGKGSLHTPKPLKTVGSYWPYAPTVWDYIQRAMPFPKPGSLEPDEVYALTAYILFRNGIIAESDEMNATTLPKVRMPNRDGFIPDPRPDVKPSR